MNAGYPFLSTVSACSSAINIILGLCASSLNTSLTFILQSGLSEKQERLNQNIKKGKVKSIDLPIQSSLCRQLGQDLLNSYIENEVYKPELMLKSVVVYSEIFVE